MHRSRLSTLVIDCETNDLDDAAKFWSRALGYDTRHSTNPETAHYVELDAPANEVQVLLQAVNHQSRVHIDIETDDIDAEVRRLEGLGAKRLGDVKTWCVMEAPSGHRFCVVQPQRTGLEDGANVWE